MHGWYWLAIRLAHLWIFAVLAWYYAFIYYFFTELLLVLARILLYFIKFICLLLFIFMKIVVYVEHAYYKYKGIPPEEFEENSEEFEDCLSYSEEEYL